MSATSTEALAGFSGSAEQKVFFGFESDFVDSLRCIPMIVRFKLDLCGVKLSLKAWSRFDHDTRAQCAHLPTDSNSEVDRYREFLCRAIERIGQQPVLLAVDQQPAWKSVHPIPTAVLEKGAALGLDCGRFSRWGELTALQRFALLKLTRKGHENENFLPALAEFGIV